jgi:hypothetical protein
MHVPDCCFETSAAALLIPSLGIDELDACGPACAIDTSGPENVAYAMLILGDVSAQLGGCVSLAASR